MAERTPRVLLVDDDLISALVAVSVFASGGYSVVRAASGEEALELFGAGGYDLVVMDIGLGMGMDGIETARRMRGAAAVPLLFLTACEEEEIRDRIKGLGAYGFARKGGSAKDLLSAACAARDRLSASVLANDA